MSTYKVLSDSRDATRINQCFLQVTLEYERVYPQGGGEAQVEMLTVCCAVLQPVLECIAHTQNVIVDRCEVQDAKTWSEHSGMDIHILIGT